MDIQRCMVSLLAVVSMRDRDSMSIKEEEAVPIYEQTTHQEAAAL